MVVWLLARQAAGGRQAATLFGCAAVVRAESKARASTACRVWTSVLGAIRAAS